MYIDPIVGFGKKTCQWATWISVATVLEPLFWGGGPRCCQHVFRIGSSERKHRMNFDDFFVSRTQALPSSWLCGDFMVIFKAFKTKVQDRKRPRIAGFLAEHGEWLQCFFFKGLYSFPNIFTYFQAPNTLQRFLPRRVHPQSFPHFTRKLMISKFGSSPLSLGGLDFSGEPTIKLQRCTYWPLQPTQVPSFYWQPHLTGRMHPLGCSLTTLVIHFHARHLFFRAFFFGVKLLKGTKRLRIWI